MALVPCPSCRRHVREEESCPSCGTVAPKARPYTPPYANRHLAALAVAASSVALVACSSVSVQPFYGAPYLPPDDAGNADEAPVILADAGRGDDAAPDANTSDDAASDADASDAADAADGGAEDATSE